MSMTPSSLDDLRRSIDQLDDALQDVLIRRAEVVAAVARLKQADATPPLRPGREAQILRRLIARHHGPFPRPILVRLWRELLSGTIAMQAELHIAVFAPNSHGGLWDLARDHYGSHTPMTALRSAGEVIGAVSDGRASLGVLPVPGQGAGQGEAGSWWRLLIPGGDIQKPRVIARLPFGARGNARSEDGDALVISRIEPEPSEADRSLFVVEIGEEVSRTRVVDTLSVAGLPATLLSSGDAGGGATAQLIEVDGWLAANDPRLTGALAALGGRILRVASLGGYALPLSAAELAETGRR
jgi:chorismate mutase/prephenate dehydratase